MDHNLKYPTLNQVRSATIDQIIFWYKNLPSPSGKSKIKEEQKVMELIKLRYDME